MEVYGCLGMPSEAGGMVGNQTCYLSKFSDLVVRRLQGSAKLTSDNAATTPDEVPAWKVWGIFDWNDRLFDYFFRSEDGSSTPVSRIFLTGNTLKSVVQDQSASAMELEDAFRNAIRDRLRSMGNTLCTDALRLAALSEDGEIPQYFSHLAATCFAASGTGGSATTQNDFRGRLNKFLGGSGNRYLLRGLRELWEELRDWLDWAAAEHGTFRRLILPAYNPNLAIIGHSVGLAFPAHRDLLALRRIVHSHDYLIGAPLLPLLKEIARARSQFSPEFLSAVALFEAAFLKNAANLYEDPIWSAIREASTSPVPSLASPVESNKCSATVQLDRGLDWKFTLRFVLTGMPRTRLPHGIRAVEAGDFSSGSYTYALKGGIDTAQGTTDVIDWLLGADEMTLTHIVGKHLAKILAQGLLIFTADESGTWRVSLSRQTGSEIRALVRNDVLPAFTDALASSSPSLRRRDSRYAGWTELDGITGDQLSSIDLSGLEGVSVLQRTVETPVITVREGVRVPGGWLGLKRALPSIYFSGADSEVSLLFPPGTTENPGTHMAIRVGTQGTFQIPSKIVPAEGLGGEVVVRGHLCGDIKISRKLSFHRSCLSVDYRPLGRANAWLSEGGNSDVGELTRDGRSASEVSLPTELSAECPVETIEFGNSNNPEEEPIRDLVEVLAGLASGKAMISVGEVLSWTSRLLGCSTSFAWLVLRSWEESGLIDFPLYRRWRARTVLVRRPRIIVSGPTHVGNYHGVVQGVIPRALCSALAQAAQDGGIACGTSVKSTPWVPASPLLIAPSLEALTSLSTHLSLEPVESLRRMEDVLRSVRNVHSRSGSLRRNHNLVGYWHRSYGRFVKQRPKDDTVLERYSKDDVPDSFVIRRGNEELYHSYSRNWALLRYYEIIDEQPFETSKDVNLVQAALGVFLPLAVARWVHAASGLNAGPAEANESAPYVYYFPNNATRSRAISLLWGKSPPQWLSKERRRLERLVIASSGRSDVVALSSRVRGILQRHSDVVASSIISRLTFVDRRILAHVARFAALVERCSD